MKRILIITALLLTIALAFSFEKALVIRAVDGDTLKVLLDNQEETIRLIGVDTPESVHPFKPVEPGAIAASDFTKQLTARTVYLTYDKDRYDYYHRLLAYVWISEKDGHFLCWNLYLILTGHGKLYDKYPFGMEEWFKEVLTDAGIGGTDD
jgi:micrococcal nuclease